jgi:integrase
VRRHHARQGEERLKLGDAWTDLDLVFPNAVRHLYEPSNFARRQVKPLLRRAGFPPEIRFHNLRHTAATLLLGHGINPKVVSEMLGHANISITLNVYGHVLPHMQQEAADLMDRLLWGT